MSIGSELSIRMLTVAVLLLLQDETQAVKAADPMGDGTIEGSFDHLCQIPAGILNDIQALPIHLQPRLIPAVPRHTEVANQLAETVPVFVFS